MSFNDVERCPVSVTYQLRLEHHLPTAFHFPTEAGPRRKGKAANCCGSVISSREIKISSGVEVSYDDFR
jgi:hypothetical protein